MSIRRLHIGGTVRKEGWEVLNANPGPHVDHLGNAKDLSQFPDGTFGEVYASHVLEHFDHAREVQPVLCEWARVLAPDGRMLVAVPDLDVLCRLFLDRQRLSSEDRHFVTMMIYGGHIDQYDFHYAGFNDEILADRLRHAGFKACQRVDSFGVFEDTSTMLFKGTPISLNMIAWKVWPPPSQA
ncbi:MAG: methyltransferase domain-containing protein [Planctomycetes bacterium]|nr:methyltransferase domain-containing protein [Planctomycetota bacterium]